MQLQFLNSDLAGTSSLWLLLLLLLMMMVCCVCVGRDASGACSGDGDVGRGEGGSRRRVKDFGSGHGIGCRW